MSKLRLEQHKMTPQDLCVLPDPGGEAWTVSICHGDGTRGALGRFASRDEAAAFALEERQRRAEQDGTIRTVHFPDDCPCIRNRSK
jgi:hypothetical protein